MRSYVSEDFGERIKKILVDNNVKAHNTTAFTNISQEHVRRMTHGIIPSEEVIIRFANGFKLSEEETYELLVSAGKREPRYAVAALQKALSYVIDITDEQKAELISIAEQMADKNSQNQ